MSTKPHLSPRAVVAYNCLSREVAALNYLVRVAKPSGTLGEAGLTCLGRALRIANRLYRREPGMPSFGRINPREPMTAADVALMVARLSAAGIAFEERYAHLTEAGQSARPVYRSADGLPSPHA